MSPYQIFEDRLGGPWHPTASTLAAAPRPAHIAQHLEGCLRCRVQALRLAAAERQHVSETAVAALLPNSPVLPDQIMAVVRDTQPSNRPRPAAGELWRATNHADAGPGTTALLVWIRKTFTFTTLVLPVVLDIEMADDETLLLSPEDSHLGLPAAVLTGVDAEILTANLTTRIAVLDIAVDVAAVRDVVRGRTDTLSGQQTGSRIVRDDDQRIDYRQAMGEMLAALGPLPEEEVDTPQERHDSMTLVEALRDLSYYEHGLRIEPIELARPQLLDANHIASPVATVHHLSTCVLVALVTGNLPSRALTGLGIAEVSSALLVTYPEADIVAVCAAAPDWPAILLGPADSGPAIGVPSGAIATAGARSAALELLTALQKHFDGAQDTWQDAAPVHFHDTSARLSHVKAVGAAQAHQAVEEVRKVGRRAVIPSKRAGYQQVDDTTVSAVQGLLDAVLAGDDATAAVEELLGGNQ